MKTMRWAAAALLWLGLGTAAAADGGAPAAASDDGPYLRWQGAALQARWVCDGRVVERAVAPGRADGAPLRIAPVCGYAHPIEVHAAEPAADPQWAFEGVRRIAALSDIHGQYPIMRTLLQAHGVIDDADRWTWGAGHLVIAGDIFDRGDTVNEALWLVYGLQRQAAAAGGRVHFLLGNHETMVLYDDLRYVNPKYLATAERFGETHADLYAAGTVLGDWLRGLPAIVRIDDSLFVHGGLSEAFAALELDPGEVNARFRASVGLPRDRIRADPVLDALYRGDTSPVWYRGYFREGALAQADVDAIARRWGVQRIVVGHTSQPRVERRFEGRVVAIDSSIKDGNSGELLLIEDGRLQRGLLDGRRLALD